jgi:NAD(P)-dependent dehydrogenase (short-subunit alcohol dehydrogenase family)
VSKNSRRRLLRYFQTSILSRNRSNEIGHENTIGLASCFGDRHKASAADMGSALIVGVGPGFGFGIARRLATAGMDVALASRNAERLDPFANETELITNRAVRAYGCDATNESSVKELLSHVSKDMGVPRLVIYSVQGFGRSRSVDTDVPAFEEYWRQNCLGGFIVAREAARTMLPLHRGTIVLVGSGSSVVGRAEHLNLAVGKFGLRAIALVMARELWPNHIHVVHLIIDGEISEEAFGESNEPQLFADQIADTVLALHNQPRSTWTSEIDVRPWNEAFWEHW